MKNRGVDLRKWSVVAVGFLLVLAAALYATLAASLPRRSGEARLATLNAPVTIELDVKKRAERSYERGPEPPDRRRVQRGDTRLATHAVGAKESLCHGRVMRTWTVSGSIRETPAEATSMRTSSG